MRNSVVRVRQRNTWTLLAVVLVVTNVWAGAHEKVLHNFNGKSGGNPGAGLIFDGAGNLYGTTTIGGHNNGGGTVYELTSKRGGGWTMNVLYTFQGDGRGGTIPEECVTRDNAGNLYGTTESGGAYGDGVVFELMPEPGGGWKEKVLHYFNGKDGDQPNDTLAIDPAGNLYGTTYLGGAENYGVIFEIIP